jgi:hypothetical protein
MAKELTGPVPRAHFSSMPKTQMYVQLFFPSNVVKRLIKHHLGERKKFMKKISKPSV